ncbi:hypothetical protein M3J09_005586 [Ascochyta lentis]
MPTGEAEEPAVSRGGDEEPPPVITQAFVHPTQADWFFIREMDPNRSDSALKALNYDYEFSSSDDDMLNADSYNESKSIQVPRQVNNLADQPQSTLARDPTGNRFDLRSLDPSSLISTRLGYLTETINGFTLPAWEVDEAQMGFLQKKTKDTMTPLSYPTFSQQPLYGVLSPASNDPSQSYIVNHQSTVNSDPQRPDNQTQKSVLQDAGIHALRSEPMSSIKHSFLISPQTDKTLLARLPVKRKTSSTRLALPITLEPHGIAATVLACADTGAEVNIISEELAHLLSNSGFQTCGEEDFLVLANGMIVEALGKVTTSCSFGVGTFSKPLTCVFHVLRKVVTPLIMGVDFLEETKTMTEHRERLIRVPRLSFQSLSIRSVGRPRKRMSCEIGGGSIWALPDSGSEVNLIAPLVASALKLPVEPLREALQLVDGTTVRTSGLVRTSVSINPHAPTQHRKFVHMEFLLLDSFQHSAIVGIDSLDELGAFAENSHALVTDPDTTSPLELNRIRYLGSMDNIFEWFMKKIQRRGPPNTVLNTADFDQLSDQRELNRRESEAARISGLSPNEQDIAIDLEALRQEEYERQRHTGNPRTSNPPAQGGHQCDHPGCNAAPFQTQYLLNCHANVHSQS